MIILPRSAIIIDDYTLAPNKRGDLRAGLGSAGPSGSQAKRLGLSATVADKQALRRFHKIVAWKKPY